MREGQNPEPGHFRRFVLAWGKTMLNLLTPVGGRLKMPRSVRLALA